MVKQRKKNHKVWGSQLWDSPEQSLSPYPHSKVLAKLEEGERSGAQPRSRALVAGAGDLGAFPGSLHQKVRGQPGATSLMALLWCLPQELHHFWVVFWALVHLDGAAQGSSCRAPSPASTTSSDPLDKGSGYVPPLPRAPSQTLPHIWGGGRIPPGQPCSSGSGIVLQDAAAGARPR